MNETKPSRPKRPYSLVIASMLLLVQASLFSVLVLSSIEEITQMSLFQELTNALDTVDVTRILDAQDPASDDLVERALLAMTWAVLALLSLVWAIGLFRVSARAWIGAMIDQGVVLSWGIYDYLTGQIQPIDYLFIFLAVSAVLFLNQIDTQHALSAEQAMLESQMGKHANG